MYTEYTVLFFTSYKNRFLFSFSLKRNQLHFFLLITKIICAELLAVVWKYPDPPVILVFSFILTGPEERPALIGNE